MLWTFGAERSSDGAKGTDRHGNGSLNLQRSSYLYLVSFILGRANASPSNTQGGSPVRESRPPESVRGRSVMGVPTAIGLVLVSSDGLRGCRTAQQVGHLSLARDTNDRTMCASPL